MFTNWKNDIKNNIFVGKNRLLAVFVGESAAPDNIEEPYQSWYFNDRCFTIWCSSVQDAAAENIEKTNKSIIFVDRGRLFVVFGGESAATENLVNDTEELYFCWQVSIISYRH